MYTTKAMFLLLHSYPIQGFPRFGRLKQGILSLDCFNVQFRS